jgi:hypothetical protein
MSDLFSLLYWTQPLRATPITCIHPTLPGSLLFGALETIAHLADNLSRIVEMRSRK